MSTETVSQTNAATAQFNDLPPNTYLINSVAQNGIPCPRWEAFNDRMSFDNYEACKKYLKDEFDAEIKFVNADIHLVFKENDSYMRWLITI